jgi:uncharacterized protein (DUF3820 family)
MLNNSPTKSEPFLKSSLDCEHEYGEARQVGPHIGIYCCDCGKWLHWDKQTATNDPNFVMPFGEHKGQPIKKLPTDYLDWGARNFKGSMQERFKLALQKRYKDFGRAMNEVTIGLTMVTGFCDVSLKEAVEKFAIRFHIDAGRVHQYLALYDSMRPEDAYTIKVNHELGTIIMLEPKGCNNSQQQVEQP